MDKVSVIMPCYNDGIYIEQAIESVKKQSYKNIELIVIDDGSEENTTISIINRLKEMEKSVIFLRTSHLGPAGARNYGIRQAEGKFILPLDSDDIISETYVEKCLGVLKGNENIGAVYCLANLFGEKEGKWELPIYSFENMLVDNIVFVTAMFRKTDWEAVGGFDTSMEAGMEDYSFWLSILELGKEIYQIPEVLFHYRIKKESRTSGYITDVEKTKEIYRKIYYSHYDFYQKHAEEYALALRDAIIEQMYFRRKYEKRFEYFKALKKIPYIKWLVRKIFKEL